MRILLADDSADAAHSLRLLLETRQHNVIVATDGLEAIEMARAYMPEVMILDIGMQRLNGYDVASRVRQQPWGRDILLIALTGYGDAGDISKSYEGGFNLHYVKPSNFQALIASLDDWSARRVEAAKGPTKNTMSRR